MMQAKIVIKSFFQSVIRDALENEGCVYGVMVIGHRKIYEYGGEGGGVKRLSLL